MLLLIPTLVVILILLLVAGISIAFDSGAKHVDMEDPIVFSPRPLSAWDPAEDGYEKIGPNEWVGYKENMRIHLKRVEAGWLVDTEMLVGINVLDYEED